MRINRLGAALALAALSTPLAACDGVGEGGGGGGDIDSLTIVVPYAAGGPTDLAARQLVDPLSEALDANVTVVNREGGSAIVGTTEVASSNGRDDKILYSAVGPLILGEISDETTYDLDSFVPLRAMVDQPAVYVASVKSGIKSIDDIPEDYKVATVGAQTIEALAMPVLDSDWGTKGTAVPFGGSSAVAEAVIGSQVDIGVVQPTNAKQYIDDGRMVPLFVVQPDGERSPVLPDVPNLDELGGEVTSADLLTPLTGFVAPKDMDEDKVEALREAMAEASGDAAFQKFAADNGMTLFTDEDLATTGWYDDLSAKVELIESQS